MSRTLLYLCCVRQMAGEEPRILFLHYWGVGPVHKLAHAVRGALDLTAAGKPH